MTDTSFSRRAFHTYAAKLVEMADVVAVETSHLHDRRESDGTDEFLAAAADIAWEMFFQKGDPAVPELTDWELPWRKFGGDNPTTSYLSAPVSSLHRYRLSGSIGSATYVGLQAYTKGPGYNAPSANISDLDLVRDGVIDCTIGGPDPGDGSPWLPLVDGDYLVMARVYHDRPTPSPHLTIRRIDDASPPHLPAAERLASATAFFEEAVRSTISVTEVLRLAGANAYPPADAPVRRPQYTGALFPTLDNVYDGFWVDLPAGHALRLRGVLPEARYTSFVFYDRWFCTPDFRRVRCYLTADEVEVASDGTYEILVGPDDPGHANWIDTDGLRQGIFALRNLLPTLVRLPDADVVALR